MEKVIVFIAVAVIMTLILNNPSSDAYIRDKDTNELIFRYRSIVRWVALICVLFFFLLMYKTVPEYFSEEPTNWFGVIVMPLAALFFLCFYAYVTITRVIIREDDRIIHQSPLGKTEIEFQDIKELIWRVDRGGGDFCMKGTKSKIKVNPLYVDYFTIHAKVKRMSKNAIEKKLVRN